MIAFLMLACAPGTADFTITNLGDSTSQLEEAWTAQSAFWHYSGNSDGFALWSFSAETQTFTHQGDHYVLDNLLLTTSDKSCDEVQEWLDEGEAALANVQDGDPATDHCEALTGYFDYQDSLEPAGERVIFNSTVDGLEVGRPTPGTFDGRGGLFWGDGAGSDATGWNAETCSFEHLPYDDESQTWDMDDVNITIDRVAGGVAGTLTALMDEEDKSSSTVSVDFRARACRYNGVAALVYTD